MKAVSVTAVALLMALPVPPPLANAQLQAQSQSQAQTATKESRPPAFTLEGDIALLTVAIKPDKTADFERVLVKLHEALVNSSDPLRRQQAAGWKVMKMPKPMPDGNVAYVHVVSPVVKGADYSVLQTLYDEFPNDRQALYELFRGAFVQNLALSAGVLVMDVPSTESTR